MEIRIIQYHGLKLENILYNQGEGRILIHVHSPWRCTFQISFELELDFHICVTTKIQRYVVTKVHTSKKEWIDVGRRLIFLVRILRP